MKILFNCLNLEKGGAQRVISILANEFSLNNEVTILMLRNEISYKVNSNIKIISLEKSPKNNFLTKISLLKLKQMAKQIENIQPDVIISFLPEPSLKLMLIKKFNRKIKKIPTIISIRNDPQKEYQNKIIYEIMKYLYQNVDKLVLQTTEAYHYFQKILPNNKLCIIPNPIAPEFLVEKSNKKKDKKEIVTVGRLVKQKNHKLLIASFSKVKVKHPDLKLLIYGKGPLEMELKNFVKQLNLENDVIFKGEVDDIENHIAKARLFVLSSDYEGMPNALLEAMALGIPCIATDCPCGGPQKIIKNNINGILVPLNDEKELTKAILNLIENENLSKSFAQQGHLRSQEYNPKQIGNLWHDVIQEICK